MNRKTMKTKEITDSYCKKTLYSFIGRESYNLIKQYPAILQYFLKLEKQKQLLKQILKNRKQKQ